MRDKSTVSINSQTSDTFAKLFFFVLCCFVATDSFAKKPGNIASCDPKRAVRTLDFKPLDIPTPRVPLIGDITYSFTITVHGRAVDIQRVRSGDWVEWNVASAIALESAQFDAPTKPCRQTMQFRYSSKDGD
jgi:hypothetical protein